MKGYHLFKISMIAGCLIMGILITANAQSVARFGVFETSFTHSGTVSNPFTSLEGTVTFTSPSGKTYSIPMFWDGSTTWKVRFSPNETGSWSYSTSSSNSGLSGKTGTFSCTTSTNKGGIKQKQGSTLHFQYENGDNMYFMGDTQWDLFIDRSEASLNLSSVKTYFDVRSSQDFNAIHATLVRGSANEGGNAFPTRYSVLNPGYFQAVDTRIKYANDKGLTIGIAIISGENIKTHISGGGSESDIIRIAKYAAARYSAYNVYFLLGMEYQEAGRSTTFWNNMGNTVANADPHDRLIGNHAGGMQLSREYAAQSWAGFGDYMQMQDKSRQYSEAITSRSNNKPVVNGEYGYYQVTEGPGVENNLDSMRARTYNIAMAGAYAVTGFGPTYAGGRRSPSNPLFNPNYSSSADWAEDFKYLKRVFSSVDYWTLTPNNNLVSGSGTKYVLANVGNQYLVYIKGNSGSNTLSLGTQTSKSYTVQRYDPRQGTFTDLTGYTGNGSIVFANPDNKDWIYVVKASGTSTNNPPSISSLTVSTTTGVAPLKVDFSVSATDPEGNALTYSWDLNGDGIYNEGTTASVSFNYASAGTYTATVRVSDGTNSPVTRSVIITVSGSGTVVNGSIPWTEDFTFGNGTTSDNGATSWSLVTTGVNSGAIASVQNNELQFSNLGVEAKWLSGPISVSGAGDIKISAKLNSSNSGTLEAEDYLALYYTINNGSETLISSKSDDFAAVTVSSTITVNAGDVLRLIVKARNTATNEFFYLDNVKVENAGITTNNPPVINSLTASTTTGVAPLAVSFSVSASDPENNTLTYSWDLNGDGTFGDNTSTSPSYNYIAAGTYTVSVRVSDGTNSPVSRSVVITVTGTSTPPTTTSGTSLPWVEDFTLSNGTTVDNGSTKWSLVTTGMTATATFSVQNNQLTISDVDTEVKWLSEEITIGGAGSIRVSAKFNSNNSGNLDPDDYLGLYYTINGGSEITVSNQFDDFASNIVSRTFNVAAGDKIRVIAKARNTSTNEIYYLDDVKVENVTVAAKVTSVEESASQVNIYPNPASDKITFTGVLPGTAFDIYNMSGSFIRSGTVSESYNSIEDLAAGIYFIRLKDQAATTFRIIKQ